MSLFLSFIFSASLSFGFQSCNCIVHFSCFISLIVVNFCFTPSVLRINGRCIVVHSYHD